MAEHKSDLIYRLMGKIQGEVEAISKERQNQQQGYKFRGVEDVLNMMHKLLSKYEVFVVTRRIGAGFLDHRTTSNNKVVTTVINDFEFDFCAPDGSKVTVGPLPGEGVDYSDKASNKTMANAYKYCMFLTFSIPTQELVDEPDETSPEGAPKAEGSEKPKQQSSQSGGNTGGTMEELRAKLDQLLESGGFDDKEVKQAKAMSSKIKDAASMANMIKAWEKKKGSVTPQAESVTPEQVAEAVQGELVEDPAKTDDFDDDIPF